MQQGGGSQYGVPPPDMSPFGSPSGAAAPRAHMLGMSGPEHLQAPQQQQPPEAASPISSRPPPSGLARSGFDELVPCGAGPGSFPDDDALAVAGEEAERGSVPGNRWPRQETLALLKIRSDMDAAFRDATLKGPLWEDVSRKLAELGYVRSAKKCKEKFENVHKYYKRTKEGRAGRQDGKSYRFFSQLEALHSSGGGAASSGPGPGPGPNPTACLPAPPIEIGACGGSGSGLGLSSARIQPLSLPAAAPPPIITTARGGPDLTAGNPGGLFSTATAAAAGGISFSSNTSSSSSSESDDEETEERGMPSEGRKRKHGGSSGGGSRKMMAFFEGLMKQVMERQETMQQRFLETIEKREQDRMIREEAWKRQEMARLNREHELMAQERAMAASRDAAVVSFLQKISGQTIQLPPAATVIPAAPPPQPSPPTPTPASHNQHSQPSPHHSQPQQPPPSLPTTQPPQQQQQQQHHHHHHHHQGTEIVRHLLSSSTELVPAPDPHDTPGSGGGYEPVSSSRWPKAEVHALIKLRSGLEARYQEAGPKGPLWEEISSEMQRLGYNRSSKRCKEKWENINKYFKKVKESNKKRPEDAKTCPYFHQLDALYRKKLLGSGSGGGGGIPTTQRLPELESHPTPSPQPQERPDMLAIMPPPPQPAPQQPQTENTETKNGNGPGNGNSNKNSCNPEGGGGDSTGIQIQTSNGGLPPSFFEEGTTAGGGAALKKPEDIMKELMEQQHHPTMEDYDKTDDPDSDHIEQDDDDEDDDDDDEDRKMQYKIQFQRPNVGNSGGSTGQNNAPTKTAAAAATGSFLAMVQ